MLKELLKTDYRGVATHLCDSRKLSEAKELEEPPQFTKRNAADQLLLWRGGRWTHLSSAA